MPDRRGYDLLGLAGRNTNRCLRVNGYVLLIMSIAKARLILTMAQQNSKLDTSTAILYRSSAGANRVSRRNT